MRRFFPLAIILCIYVTATNAQTKATQKKAIGTAQTSTAKAKPSIRETMDWLEQKFRACTPTENSKVLYKEDLDLWKYGHNIVEVGRTALYAVSIVSKDDSIQYPAISFFDTSNNPRMEIGLAYNECKFNVSSGTLTKGWIGIPICDIDTIKVFTSEQGAQFLVIVTGVSKIRHGIFSKIPLKFHIDLGGVLPPIEDWRKYRVDNLVLYRQHVHIPFDVNREPDLVSKINDAIKHLKTFCKEDPKEPF